MEDKRNEMMYITTYADDTGLFSERECNFDNTAGFEVPRWIIEEWLEVGEGIGFEEGDTFEDWYDSYIHDELIGFYDFCIIKGFVPNLLDKEFEDKVFYEDDEGNKQIVFEGTYDECRRYGRLHNWKYYDWWAGHKYDLELEVK